MFGKALINDDYHIVIFHTTPPPRAIIDNEEYELKTGTLLCMAPGGVEIIVEPTKAKSPPKYVAISIKRNFLEEILFKIAGNKTMEAIIYDKHYSYKILDLLEFFLCKNLFIWIILHDL